MPRTKKKLNELEQIDGKIRQNEEESLANTQYEPTTLEQLWDEGAGFNKYNTFKEEDYLNYLGELNSAELRTHATTLGIIPSTNPDRLKKRLIMEFQKHVNIYRQPRIVAKKDKTPSKEALKVMSEVLQDYLPFLTLLTLLPF